MDIVIAFWICIAVMLLGLLVAVVNFLRGLNSFEIGTHIFAILLSNVGGLGALITGVIWVVQQFSEKS